jgi:uncharacterized BrkB/YihY/UPF0761 family membrane protein
MRGTTDPSPRGPSRRFVIVELMSRVAARVVIVTVSALIVFGVVGAILLQVLPGPRQPSDFLVIGTLATLATLAALFVAIIAGGPKMRDIFYKRRQKPGP